MHKNFDEIFEDVTKLGTKIKTDEYHQSGRHQIVDQGQENVAGYTDLEDGLFEDVPAIIFGDHTRIIKYVDQPFFLGADGVKVLRSRVEDANYRYLYYALKSVKIPNTGYNRHFKWLKTAQIKLPSAEMQSDVVTVLDSISRIVEYRQQQLQKLDDLVKARFVEMFGIPFVNDKHWVTKCIGEVVTEVRYGTSRPAVEGGKYPYLRMNNLTNDGEIDLNNLKYIDIPDNEVEKCIVRKGDVLFNRTNSAELVGKTAMFDLDEEMIIAGYIIRVRLQSCLRPEILSQYMNLKPVKELLHSMAKGAVNQANINAQELQSIEVYIPHIELQREFVAFKKQIDKSRFVVQQALDKAQLLFDSLMQKYFG